MLLLKDASQVNLTVYVQDTDGQPKLDVDSGTVRVYKIVSGAEVDVLAATSLSQVGSTNKWRYVWEPTSLPVGEYTAEFFLTDDLAKTSRTADDISVKDIATQTDLTTVKKIETGRWKIVANQMIFYDDDGLTPLFTFDLFDAAGVPTSANPFERSPA